MKKFGISLYHRFGVSLTQSYYKTLTIEYLGESVAINHQELLWVFLRLPSLLFQQGPFHHHPLALLQSLHLSRITSHMHWFFLLSFRTSRIEADLRFWPRENFTVMSVCIVKKYFSRLRARYNNTRLFLYIIKSQTKKPQTQSRDRARSMYALQCLTDQVLPSNGSDAQLIGNGKLKKFMNLPEHVLIIIGCWAFYLDANWLLLTSLCCQGFTFARFLSARDQWKFSRASLWDVWPFGSFFRRGLAQTRYYFIHLHNHDNSNNKEYMNCKWSHLIRFGSHRKTLM